MSQKFISYRVGNKTGFLNIKGEEMDLQFNEIQNFNEELAPVRVKEKWGYIDTLGKLVISLQYIQATIFSEGLALVKTSDKKWQYIDRGANVKIQLDFDFEMQTNYPLFYNGLTALGKKGKMYIINKANNNRIKLNVDAVYWFQSITP